jgi:hypothetical protein
LKPHNLQIKQKGLGVRAEEEAKGGNKMNRIQSKVNMKMKRSEGKPMMQRKERSTLSSTKAEPKEESKQGMEGIKQSIKRTTSPGKSEKKKKPSSGGSRMGCHIK